MKLTKKHLLGKGAFSEVYLEKDPTTNQSYALKIIKDKNMNLNEKYSLENEIKILNKIKHNNIIRLYYNIRIKEGLCLCLEYCNGGSLYDNLYKYKFKNGRPFPEKLVQKIMKKILSGVQTFTIME